MGASNTVLANLQCPRCGAHVSVEAECKFGDTANMSRYHLGDHYAWRPRKAFQNGGRPEDGSVDGEGYVECPACGKDFFVKVLIRGDLVHAVEPDPSRQPQLSDSPRGALRAAVRGTSNGERG
jgi:DNA-directed RNA polymerase subunit RPC12/RpoP